MPLKICSIASGSSGNCVYVASGSTALLIDAGAPVDRVIRALKVLGASGASLNVLVTHTHSDHIGHLDKIYKELGAKVFMHGLADKLKTKKVLVNDFDNREFCIGDISVSPFLVPHDVPCVGFTLRSGSGAISYMTDCGAFEDKNLNQILDSDILFIESNYDESLLRQCSYPQFLKRRIMSNAGHLSNTATAKVCKRALLEGKARQIILGHLSKESNTQELAYNTTADFLASFGALDGKDYSLEVAPRGGLSSLFEVK